MQQGFDQLGVDPLFANSINGFGTGRGGGFAPDTMTSWNSGKLEVAGTRQKGITGTKQAVGTTKVSGGVTSTTSDTSSTGLLNPKGTRTHVDAESTADTKYAKRDKTSTGLFGKTTNTQTTAFEDEDGHQNVTGKVTTTGKGGATTTKGLDAKGEKGGRAKTAEKEAGAKKVAAKGKLARLGNHVSLGSVGDESGVDLDDFTQDREEVASFADARASVDEVEGGHVATAEANAGPRVSGDVIAQGTDTDAFGNERTSTAGASGEAHAGGGVSAGARHRRTGSGAEVGANVAAKVGIGAEGAAGATTSTKLSDTIAAAAGAQVKGNVFGGVKAGGEVTAKHGKASAEIGGQARAMAGAEVGGGAGITGSIKGAGFDLVGGRAKAEGQAMAGLDAKGSGKVSADAVKGLTAEGQVAASAGAKAEGGASAGGSLGGVDGDVVAEGQAKAGADVGAQGRANVGALGGGAQGSFEAFAGAKAGGEARFELGAGGLNLGLVGIAGEVSAGAGVRLTGELSASVHKVGLKGRAGVTWGVGAGLGGLFNVDPSFPVRLTLKKLAENKVIPTDDIGDLVGSAASLVYEPVQKAAGGVAAPVRAALPDGGPTREHLSVAQPPPEQEEQLPGPDRPMKIDALLARSAGPQREALDRAQGSIRTQLDGTSKDVLGRINEVVDGGRGLYSNLMSMLGSVFSASEDAMRAADASMRSTLNAGITEAKAVGGELKGFADTVIAEIHQLIKVDPKTLLDGSWEQTIDKGVERVRAFARSVKARILAVIDRTRRAMAAMADEALSAAVAPVRSLARSLGTLVGGFGRQVSSLGLSMMGRLRDGLLPVEKGVKVPRMSGMLKLPAEVTPTLQIAEQPVRDFATFGERSVGAGMESAVDFITKGLRGVLGTQSGGLIGTLAAVATSLTGALLDTPVSLAEGAASFAKPIIRTAIAVVKAVIEAARRAAEAAAAAARAVAEAAKKAAATVVNTAKTVVNAVGSGLRKAWDWFAGLFKR